VNEVVLDIDGNPIALEVRTSPRAQRMLLRVDHRREIVVLTLPEFVSKREGLRFARGQSAWISERLAALPPRIPFKRGARVPVLGLEHRVRHHPDTRGTVWLEDGEMHVAGGIEFLSRRVSDYLRKRARQEIVRRAQSHAARIGRNVTGITLRDPATRWGSCSPTGTLSFSWRLVMAPAPVLDYVVAHEVAHLAHFNHGPRFWALLGQMIRDVDSPRIWLRDHGAALHRYG
jgi:predicted metal-dependent hydrolase